MKRRILVTAALPYANGDIHLGHLVEYIQADIWARSQKLRGNECHYVCADDAHGTPIMLRAEAENVAPEDLIRRMKDAHLRDFSAFLVQFDNYHSTHSEENRQLSEGMHAALKARGCIAEAEIRQLYDPEKGMFLPDRYVRGECPKCGAADQYGDSCESCGGAHSPADLINPVSVLSGARPILRPSRHYFLRLQSEAKDLADWLGAEINDPAGGGKTPRLQREAANKLREWLQGDLRDWDISRDPPYFGFRIPNIPDEKYFYVWLDAPIGYMASFQNLCDSKNGGGEKTFADFWSADAEGKTELYHFIGKDILYFHGLFWPTMLKNAGYRRPTRLFAHGFLTVNGEKMSKSRGTFITADHYIQTGASPEALRYYYACKLGDRVEDIDLSLDDFVARVNGDLVGKLVNIPSRVAGFVNRLFNSRLDDQALAHNPELGADAVKAYESRRYHDAIRLLMREADSINAEIDAAKPWLMAKDESQYPALHALCSNALRRFDIIIGYLSPVTPELAEKVAQFLARPPYAWADGGIPPLPPNHPIAAFRHLMRRLDSKLPRLLVQTPAGGAGAGAASSPSAPAATPPPVAIADFDKLDIRVAAVVAAEDVAESEKLLKLTLDVGETTPRLVFAGLKQHVRPADIIGAKILCLANLKPRQMRFGESQGMALTAADSAGRVVLLRAADSLPPGAKLR